MNELDLPTLQTNVLVETLDKYVPISGYILSIGDNAPSFGGKALILKDKRTIDENEDTDCDILSRYERLPIANEFFGIVFVYYVLEKTANIPFSIREWLRVLKPGGLLVIIARVKDYTVEDTTLPNKGELHHIAKMVCSDTYSHLLTFDTRKNKYDVDIAIRKGFVDYEAHYEKTYKPYSIDIYGWSDLYKRMLRCPVCRNPLYSSGFNVLNRTYRESFCKFCNYTYRDSDFRIDETRLLELWHLETQGR
ncbi:MAG: hypothetical protein DRN81_02615 [Thermoproteota archaeon]|nr:MAG: hypothetical protein DRN81_02615 [Candidatus Korarchaeota archaeon]